MQSQPASVQSPSVQPLSVPVQLLFTSVQSPCVQPPPAPVQPRSTSVQSPFVKPPSASVQPPSTSVQSPSVQPPDASVQPSPYSVQPPSVQPAPWSVQPPPSSVRPSSVQSPSLLVQPTQPPSQPVPASRPAAQHHEIVYSSLPEEAMEVVDGDAHVDGEHSLAHDEDMGMSTDRQLRPPVRDAQRGVVRRQRVLGERVYPHCTLNVEETAACFAIIMVRALHNAHSQLHQQPARPDVRVRACAQKKYRVPRRCATALMNLVDKLLPEGHQLPKNVWGVLQPDAEDGADFDPLTVQFCGGGVMPSQANRKEAHCTEPEVYYGTYTDEDGQQRSKKTLPNCRTCGSVQRKTTYVLPIERHIRVSALTQPTSCSPHNGCVQQLTADAPCPLCCAVLRGAAVPVCAPLAEAVEAQRPPRGPAALVQGLQGAAVGADGRGAFAGVQGVLR